MTRQDALRDAVRRLDSAGVSSPQLDASLLLAHVLGVGKLELRLRPDVEIAASDRARFETLLARREQRVPMAHLLGRAEFWSRTFRVTPAVLTPRPETEHVVEEALAFLRDAGSPVLADVGVGSGCLCVTLALELPRATVYGTDLSPEALTIARENAEALRADVVFREGSYLEPLTGVLDAGALDLVVTNPPYVRTTEEVDAEVHHEPRMAVYCDGEPSEVYVAIARQAAPLVRAGGRLLAELPEDPEGLIEAAIDALDAWRVLHVRPDLAGTPRVLVAERV